MPRHSWFFFFFFLKFLFKAVVNLENFGLSTGAINSYGRSPCLPVFILQDSSVELVYYSCPAICNYQDQKIKCKVNSKKSRHPMTSHPTCCCTGDPWPQRESPYSVKAVSKDWNLAYAPNARWITLLPFSYAEQLAKQRSPGVDQGSGLISQRTETFPIRADTAHSESIPRLSGAGEVKEKKKKSGVIFLRIGLRIGMLFLFS